MNCKVTKVAEGGQATARFHCWGIDEVTFSNKGRQGSFLKNKIGIIFRAPGEVSRSIIKNFLIAQNILFNVWSSSSNYPYLSLEINVLRKHHPYSSLLIGLVVNSLFQKWTISEKLPNFYAHKLSKGFWDIKIKNKWKELQRR